MKRVAPVCGWLSRVVLAGYAPLLPPFGHGRPGKSPWGSCKTKYSHQIQGYFGAATGRGRQAAKAELEKLPLPNITVKEAVKHAARIIYFAHDDNSKDKDFELEMTWVRLEGEAEDGVAVKGWGKHEEVPKELVAEAEKLAKESMVEGGGDDEEMEVEE